MSTLTFWHSENSMVNLTSTVTVSNVDGTSVGSGEGNTVGKLVGAGEGNGTGNGDGK